MTKTSREVTLKYVANDSYDAWHLVGSASATVIIRSGIGSQRVVLACPVSKQYLLEWRDMLSAVLKDWDDDQAY